MHTPKRTGKLWLSGMDLTCHRPLAPTRTSTLQAGKFPRHAILIVSPPPNFHLFKAMDKLQKVLQSDPSPLLPLIFSQQQLCVAARAPDKVKFRCDSPLTRHSRLPASHAVSQGRSPRRHRRGTAARGVEPGGRGGSERPGGRIGRQWGGVGPRPGAGKGAGQGRVGCVQAVREVAPPLGQGMPVPYSPT